MYRPKRSPTRRRRYFMPQMASLLLPGFDQWWEAQYSWAGFYTGTTVGSAVIGASLFNSSLNDPNGSDSERIKQSLGGVAFNMLPLMGGLSLHHSFRTAVWTQQQNDRFMFLKSEESPWDLMRAPLEFQHLSKWTTIIPLAAAATLIGAIALTSDTDLYKGTGDEVLFGMSASYTAGTHEEMIFRGWLLPIFYHNFDNFFWANTLSSTIFALAHYPKVKFPIVQAGLGYYFAWLTRKRNWTLSESIFIHTWYDVILITATLSIANARGTALPTFQVPIISTRF